MPMVTESPVVNVATEKVHSKDAVHAASVPIRKVVAVVEHAYPPTNARSAAVAAVHPLQPPMLRDFVV